MLLVVENCPNMKPKEAAIASRDTVMSQFDTSKCKILKNPVVINQVVFFFRKNHFLIDAFNKKLSLMKSAGITNFWFISYGKTKKKLSNLEDNRKVLKVHDLSGAFKIWICCLMFSCFVFIGEILKMHFDRLLTRENDTRRVMNLKILNKRKQQTSILIERVFHKLKRRADVQ